MLQKHVQIILGPPGTGKTSTCLKIVEDALGRGVAPERIAYLAFTRKAAYEAQERAMEQFKFEQGRLPYFRTLHSLAFKMLELKRDEMMTPSHYRKLGKILGIQFRGVFDEDLGLHLGDGLGDKCSRVADLARITLRGIEEEHHRLNLPDLTIHAVKQYAEALKIYKDENGLYDFTDLLENYNHPLDIEIAIFDEAQDLSALQYKVAFKVAERAQEVYVAGDDDQAIFSWAGASKKFLELKGDQIILPQSFRIPRAVHRLAIDVVKRIKHRYVKPWNPRIDEGKVEYVASEQEIEFNDSESWMLLARSKYLLNRLKQAVRQQGFAYTYNGKNSLDNEMTRAIVAWESLRNGKNLGRHEAKNLLPFLGVKIKLKSQESYGIEDFGLPKEILLQDWMTVLKSIPPEEREYLRSCLRNNQKFHVDPKIIISTIHQSKGGEADNVVLLLDMGRRSWESLGEDEENRVWYVALTRTRETLYLVQPRGLRYFEI
jgi:DNA helicase-2/ATP-dependent DNA helicase PcrA